MLAGRNDVKWLAQFNKRMKEFSDDGEIFHGAYGYRWRRHFGMDQLDEIVEILRNDPMTRRAVLQIWDADEDLGYSGVDMPCNDLVFFKIRGQKLHMTVCCRSNDMIWGAYGANAVHFSFLQEYLSARIGVEVGIYRQISDSFHAYLEPFEKIKNLQLYDSCPYDSGEVKPYPLVEYPQCWDEDLLEFMRDPYWLGFRNPFFPNVARPMWASWFAYRERNFDQAHELLKRCRATDWKLACSQWLDRREAKQ